LFLFVYHSFAQFFISPSFSESGTEREVNAVNSEHEKNIPNDDWRFHQLEVYHSDPEHPYCKFATGNDNTYVGLFKNSL